MTTAANLATIHPAVMAPIAIAPPAAIARMSMMLNSRAGTNRLVAAGSGPACC